MQNYNVNPNSVPVFMRRCLDIARNGIGHTLSNPLVGCVITQGDRLLSEGWHSAYGGPHAEVNAMHAIEDKSILRTCSLFVNLEPCAHHGKTLPCADLIVEMGIPHVYVGILDPNPLVAGKGIEKLRAAGIEVMVGIEEQACRDLNSAFITFMVKQRPYVVLKWAQTMDGYLAAQEGAPLAISNQISQIHNHRLRASVQAIMVGYKTIMTDNPQLNVRLTKGNNPMRIIIDPDLKLDYGYKIFTDGQPVWIMNTVKDNHTKDIRYFKCNREAMINDVFKYLHAEKIASIMVEGGRTTLTKLIQSNLWDEAWVFTGSMAICEGISAPILHHPIYKQIALKDNLMKVYKNTCSI